jgi:hypothetical protein
MIVRISGEGQYRLLDSDAARVEELRGKALEIVDSGNEDGFADAFAALLDYVREHGTPLGDDELEGSEFTGEGLIPD